MAQPPSYTPTTDFSADESANTGGRSTVRTAQLDAEFTGIQATLAATLANLSLNQRDDGEVRDERVKLPSLSADVKALLAVGQGLPRGTWLTATAYALRDVVISGANTYICSTAHTSGTFATDLAAVKWLLLALGAAVAASAIPFTATATIAATNVQAAIEEADTEGRALSAAASAATAALATNLAGSAAGTGSDDVGLVDLRFPAYLKVTSDILGMVPVSVLRNIPTAKWAGILAETNADDLSTNINDMLSASTKGISLVLPQGLINADRLVMPYGNSALIGERGSKLKHTTAGRGILSGVNLTGVSVRGVTFIGLGSSTVPTDLIGGYAAINTGLVTLTGCTDVLIEQCGASGFYNLLTTINCSDLDITRNRLTSWLVYGVLASLSDSFSIDHNYIIGCDQTGAANAYGVSATGNEAGADIQRACSISHNVIRGIPSWDGLMTHDVSGLRVIGNDIRDVRIGIDLGHNTATNEVRDLIVALNYIESTTTNTWGATPGAHNGILVTGYDASNLVDGATVVGNEVKNFFQTAGMVSAGGPSHITVQFCDRAVITGNRVRNGGAVIGASGIYVVGGNNGLVVSGNSVEGTMAPGGIRLASVTAETATITGNSIKQTNTADRGVYITGSTIDALAVGDNATNSTTPFSQATSTLTMASNDIVGTFTLSAAITSTIANVNVTAGCTILLTPTNAAAATLQGSAKCLYISARTAATSFAVSTASGVAAAGTETFTYRISF
jgi:hypothetical protein